MSEKISLDSSEKLHYLSIGFNSQARHLRTDNFSNSFSLLTCISQYNPFLCLRGWAANAYSFHHGKVFVPPWRNFCSIMGKFLFHHGGTNKYWQCLFLLKT